MATRSHQHEDCFPVSVERLFDLLIRPSAIRQWWSAANAIVVPSENGLWCAVWGDSEDEPDYIVGARIQHFEPPRLMVLDSYRYHAKSGELPFEADFSTRFEVTPVEQGAKLTVTQEGFPVGSEADEYYAACQQGWLDTFAGIAKYVEQSHGA